MKTLDIKNDTKIATNPMDKRRILFNLGIEGLLVWSKMTNPNPPRVNKKLDANPSMMY
jgi:hypothetical protein